MAALVPTAPTMDYLTAEQLVDDPRAASLFNTAKLWIATHGKSVDAGSILVFCTTLMGVVQRLVKEKHQGLYKKRLVLTVLRLALDEVEFESPDLKASVVTVLETTVVDFIDKVVLLATGQLSIHKLMQDYSPCCQPGASAASKKQHKARKHAK